MTPEQEAEWLEWRRGGIGGSDVACMASGKYGGIYGVVGSKMGHVANEIDPSLAARGHRWEEPVANAVFALTGYYVHGEQMQVEAEARPEHRATLDGLLDRRPEIAGIDDAEANLEIKTEGVDVRTTEGMRAYRQAQCQWGMYVTGKPRCILVVAKIDDVDDTCKGVTIEPIERDEFQIGLLVDLADRALDYVKRGELPEPDETTELEMVKEIHQLADPTQPAPEIEQAHDDLARWLVVKPAIKELEAERKAIEARLRDLMGSAIVAEDDWFKLRVGEPVFKFTSDSEVDALEICPEYGMTVLDRRRFKAEEPALYKSFQRPTTDRRMTIKDKTT